MKFLLLAVLLLSLAAQLGATESVSAGDPGKSLSVQPQSPPSGVYVADLVREMRAVPDRVAAYLSQRGVDFQHYFSTPRDVATWLDEIGKLALVIGIPLLVWWAVHRIVVSLNQLRLRLLSRRHESVPAARLALVLQRGIPYLPWVTMLVLIAQVGPYLRQTIFSDLSLLLPFASYYLYYRIFRRVVEGIFNIISSLSSKGILAEVRERVQQSARMLGLYLLLALSAVNGVGGLTGYGVLYQLVGDVAWMGGLIMLAYVAAQWQEDLMAVVRHLFSDNMAERLEQRSLGRARLLYSLPLLVGVLGVLLFRTLRSWLGQFEFAKRLSARLFLKKIESAANKPVEETKQLPEEYAAAFGFGVPDDDAVLIEPAHAQFEVLKNAFMQWAKGESVENSVALYGNKGVGKSCLLHQLQIVAQDLNVIVCAVPPKLVTREAANTFFLQQLGQYIIADDEGRLIPNPAMTEKTVILIDDAHNLFLSTPGGFDGYRAFVELLNAPGPNLFWCAAFNRYAWTYLDAVFRRAEYFHLVMALARWTESDIREMVLSRQAKTGYRLSYDDIIFAAGGMEDIQHAAHVESKFFRLLWEQSNGNPRIALYLWLTAVRRGPGKTLRVGLPKDIRPEMFQALSDDVLFVLAQVVRHENLSLAEAMRATSLPEGAVRHAVKIALESRLLEQVDQRYRVLTWAQPELIGFLNSRNFIYGS